MVVPENMALEFRKFWHYRCPRELKPRQGRLVKAKVLWVENKIRGGKVLVVCSLPR